jgi:hypothetical protein
VPAEHSLLADRELVGDGDRSEKRSLTSPPRECQGERPSRQPNRAPGDEGKRDATDRPGHEMPSSRPTDTLHPEHEARHRDGLMEPPLAESDFAHESLDLVEARQLSRALANISARATVRAVRPLQEALGLRRGREGQKVFARSPPSRPT